MDRYRKNLDKARNNKWEDKCDKMKDLSAPAKMQRIILEGNKQQIGTVIDKNGEYTTTPRETLEVIVKEHYPKKNSQEEEVDILQGLDEGDPDLADKIVNPQAIRAAFDSFDAHKAAGTDGIQPILIQKGLDHLMDHLVNIYKLSIKKAKIPKKWTESRAAFIPKPLKQDYSKPSSLRPLSLTQFLFKGLERLICWYIQDTTFRQEPLHKNIYSYREGRGTEDALHNLVSKIEKSLEKNEICVVLFLDITAAFNNAKVSTMLQNMKDKGIDSGLIRWFKYVLENREIIAELQGEIIRWLADQGTPQGAISSGDVNWNLVSENLQKRFPRIHPTLLFNYADDYLKMARGIDIHVIMDLLRKDVKILQEWAEYIGVDFSPEKTKLMCFTNKKKVPKPVLLLKGKPIEWVKEYKYLGVTIDDKLTWNSHIDNVVKKANFTMQRCRTMIGKKYGPIPKVCKWIYEGIVLPIISYGSIVWINAVNKTTVLNKLRKVQRRGCLAAMNGMKSTPTAGMEVMMNIRPIDIYLKEVAISTYNRLKLNGTWAVQEGEITGKDTHSVLVPKLARMIPELSKQCDTLSKREYIQSKFKIDIGKKSDFIDKEIRYTPTDITKVHVYTDGSKTKKGTGCSYLIKGKNFSYQDFYTLEDHCTVFQAEVLAIQKACNRVLEEDLVGNDISFYVDSQAAIRAVNKYLVKSKLIRETKNVLNTICSSNLVVLSWIPSHVGYIGNEIADRLAKLGTRNPMGLPKIDLGVNRNYYRTAIRAWGLTRHKKRWKNRTDCRQTKMILPDINDKCWKTIFNMKRKNIMHATQIITGHNTLNRHLAIMGIEESSICQKCGLEPETTEHLVKYCPAFADKRKDKLGEYFLTKSLDKYKLNKILTFVNATNRLMYNIQENE